jgi:hypothetical protein
VSVKHLTIRRIAFTTPREERARLVEEGKGLSTDWMNGWSGLARSEARSVPYHPLQKSVDSYPAFLASLLGQWVDARLTAEPEQAEWSLKTNLKAYYQHEWAEMQRILSGNCRLIRRVDVEGREAQGRIRREYEASVGKLRPLLARIAATDRLIDLVVYRLHGLTEEEVAVVEGISRG